MNTEQPTLEQKGNPPGCICRYNHKSDPMCEYEPPHSNELLDVGAILLKAHWAIFSKRHQFFRKLEELANAHLSDKSLSLLWPDALTVLTRQDWLEAARIIDWQPAETPASLRGQISAAQLQRAHEGDRAVPPAPDDEVAEKTISPRTTFEVRNGPTSMPCDHCGRGVSDHVCPPEKTTERDQSRTITSLCDRLNRIHHITCDATRDSEERLTAISEWSGGFMPIPVEKTASAQDAWNAIDALIKPGDLGGNGLDKTAERNGLILAANAIAGLPGVSPLKSSPEKSNAADDEVHGWQCGGCNVINEFTDTDCAFCKRSRILNRAAVNEEPQ